MALQTREMFNFAERNTCRHQGLVAYFGETLSLCRVSCDVCSKSDILAKVPTVAQSRPILRDKRPTLSDEIPDMSDAMFIRLKTLRRRLADEKGIPAYLVFSDAVLLQMVAQHPSTEATLSQISGIGPKKLSQYGALFLAELKKPT